MKRTTILCGLLALLGTGAVVWQNRSLANLRGHDGDAMTVELIAGADDAVLKQDLIALREEAKELPKLRNEVGQLRTVRAELASARAENSRLSEAKRTGAVIPRETPAGFISKERLMNAGLGTAEDALRTFFWATREGNLAATMDLMPDKEGKEYFEKLTPEDRAREESDFRNSSEVRAMSAFHDFGVAQRDQISEDMVVLHVRSSAATNTFPFEFKRVGAEWRLNKVFR